MGELDEGSRRSAATLVILIQAVRATGIFMSPSRGDNGHPFNSPQQPDPVENCSGNGALGHMPDAQRREKLAVEFVSLMDALTLITH